MHVRPAGSLSWPELYCAFMFYGDPSKNTEQTFLLHPYLFTVTYLLLILRHLLGPGLGFEHLTSFNISGSKYSQSSFGSRGYLCTVMASDLVRILTVTFSSDLLRQTLFQHLHSIYTSTSSTVTGQRVHKNTSWRFRHVPSGLLQHGICQLTQVCDR